MERRQFISVSSMSFLLSGCMGVTLSGSNESDSPAVNATGSITPDSATGTGTPKQPHDLYVMNYTTTAKTVTVSVLDENKNTIISGQYEIPGERGIEFEDIGAWQKTYEIKLLIDDTELSPLMWETASCASVEEAPQGSRNGYVRLHRADTDGFQATLTMDGCDQIVGPEYPTGPAQGFRVKK